jgi:adenylate cyclase
MFLDLTSSTTTAEELGHVQYFAFLNDYFRDLTMPIIAAHGVIYQYVGDEVVVSWERTKGLADRRCIRCFYDCMSTIEERAEYYRQAYGVVPAFKAGMHLGEATVGEIGSIKKDIVYSGDALNTCARIQSLCNTYEEDLLISDDLAEALTEARYPVEQREIGEVTLRGRQRPVTLFAVHAP